MAVGGSGPAAAPLPGPGPAGADADAQGPTPFSQTSVWQGMRDYYSASGISAWDGTVPYHATSNPVIADSYANVVLRFITDVMATGRFDPDEPFYIVELGAGSGKFGFHLLRRLTELRRDLGLLDVKVVHVMTDIATTNIEHWRSHPQLRPFAEAGMLAFARLDVEVDSELRLVGADDQEEERVADFANPPILIANYLFDSVSQDYFVATEGRLEEMLGQVVPVERDERAAAATAPGDHGPEVGRRRLEWTPRPTTLPHYHDVELDRALAERLARTPDAAFLFPIGSLRFLRRLMAASRGRLCVIASDLGESELGMSRNLELVVGNGFFYTPVDLDIVGSFISLFGPGYHTKAPSNALETSVSVVGFEPGELGETKNAFATHAGTFGASG